MNVSLITSVEMSLLSASLSRCCAVAPSGRGIGVEDKAEVSAEMARLDLSSCDSYCGGCWLTCCDYGLHTFRPHRTG